ncbi:MAG TPA: hypothetical protein ENJ46_01300, partial [Hellea balneolensis]|nr:hypothetical protein [Hellea balneolensis]
MSLLFKSLRFGTYSTLISLVVLSAASKAFATGPAGGDNDQVAKFRQLEPDLPSPNMFRSASGAPGSAYWQQKVDYVIDVTLDEDRKKLTGSET